MDEQKETRLYTLLEAHEKIAGDIASNQVLAESDISDHVTGESEALLRIEEMIEEMVDDE